MKIKFSNIKWDCEESDEFDYLPTAFETEIEEADEYDNEEELADFLSDWLSDEYGYCHKGFDFEVIK